MGITLINPLIPVILCAAQTLEGREDKVGFVPVVIRTRHFRPPRIEWMHVPAAIGRS